MDAYQCPYFESCFPTVDFQISEMPIDFLGVGTGPLPGRFQLQTPNKSIGPSEVARWTVSKQRLLSLSSALPLVGVPVGGRFLKIKLPTAHRRTVNHDIEQHYPGNQRPAPFPVRGFSDAVQVLFSAAYLYIYWYLKIS